MHHCSTSAARRTIAASLVLAAGITGCSDTTAPKPLLTGRYVLASYDGAPLPAIIGTSTRPSGTGGDPVQCNVELHGLSLEMIGTTVTRYETTRERCENGLQIPTFATYSNGRQTRAGARAVISFDFPHIGVVERSFARPTDAGFVVEQRDYDPAEGSGWTDDTPLTFERVP